MPLDLIDLRRGSANKYSWIPPFDFSVVYDNERWWTDVRCYYTDEPWFVQILEDGVEVARVELDDPGGINPNYRNVPKLASPCLEIQFIEVSSDARRRHIGTRTVDALAQRHSDRRLMAYSEEADEFWDSLGWERFDHPDGRHRALFIQPPR